MAEKKQVRIYEADKKWLHEYKRYGEDYAEAFSRLREAADETEAQPAD